MVCAVSPGPALVMLMNTSWSQRLMTHAPAGPASGETKPEWAAAEEMKAKSAEAARVYFMLMIATPFNAFDKK